MTREAILYEKRPNGKVLCTACARYCEIGKGQIGLCGIRGNENGKLDLYVYGKVIAGHVDPIEKKPVIHYNPGSKIFSIATTGCNWLCKYCQNSDISQRRKVEGVDMTPEQVANTAVEHGADGDSIHLQRAFDIHRICARLWCGCKKERSFQYFCLKWI